jgi:regulator of sirC expression with transglutaminase-like and TPR domain
MTSAPTDPLMQQFRAACEGGEVVDLSEATLLMGALDRREADLAPYRAHLADLARAARKHREVNEASVRGQILADVMGREFGYEGDPDLLDNPENSNLLSVIDRRLGLPVTLGILYLHTARAAGWPAEGLGFPTQFLMRVEGADGVVVLDPYDGGRVLEQADLYSLLHRTAGRMARFDDSFLEPVGDDTILLRVLNNLRAMAFQQGNFSRTLEVLDRMLVLAPREAALLYDQAQLLTEEGRPMAAKKKLEQVIALDPEGAFAERSRDDLAGIKHKLN